uniref:phosphatidate cytidylyltransferase n=1 Tax=Nocardioides sp. REDSEA-S30_B4 TaxID=1811552 RepID=UPI000A751104
MSTAPPSAGPAPLSGLVRVTVASGSRRVDLVLPGAVPVAELVPELARSVGLLDPLTVHGGYTVTGPDGRRLAGDAGLVLQGVEDGALLTVSAGVDAEPPRVYDDVVEAMTDVVERDLRPWSPASGRRTALGAAGLLLVLGAGSLLLQTDSTLAGTAAALVAATLLAGSVVLSRVQGEPEAAVAVSWTASLYAVVAGLLLAADGGFGPSAVGAGLGAMVVVSLFLFKDVFVAVVVLALGVGLWELARALGTAGIKVPFLPVLTGGTLMLVGAYYGGMETAAVAMALTVIGTLVWRLSDGADGFVRDASAGVFCLSYLHLMGVFVMLMLVETDGPWRIVAFIVATVASDVGGYAAGVFLGKHPMAPTISPKKS